MITLKSPHLRKGDTIGVVAPSFQFPLEIKGDSYFDWYLKGRKEIEEMGFKIKLGKNINKIRWWTAGTPQDRAEDINLMFSDPDVKVIICHDGGHSASTVLDYIDYENVKKHPKPFIGFSDITNFHIAFYAKCGLIGFHMGLLSYELGWVWNILYPDKKEFGKKYFTKILTETKPLGLIHHNTEWQCLKKGKAKGKLFGGNLSELSSLIGTKYFPNFTDIKNCILFWEINNVASYRIEKHLFQLKYSGILNNISGMLIGKLSDIKKTGWQGQEEPLMKEIVLESLKDFDFPILADVDFGHKTIQIPMPIGIEAEMNAEKLEINFLESAVI